MVQAERSITCEELRRWADLWGSEEAKGAALRIAGLVEAGEVDALLNISTVEDWELRDGHCALLRSLARLAAGLLHADGGPCLVTMDGLDAADQAIGLMSKADLENVPGASAGSSR